MLTSFVWQASDLCKGLTPPLTGKTVLDGEIVCLDKRGRPQFRDLLFHRRPCFYAFDLLMYGRKDIRSEKRTDRKHELKRALTGLSKTSRLQYADHVEQHGTALFQRVCKMELEGIVAKHAFGPYVADENGRHGSKSEILSIHR